MSSITKSASAQPDLRETERDLIRTYNPANAHESMLVQEIAQTWHRLQFARDAERRYFDGRDAVEAMTENPAEFKTITRFVTDCDRAWRYALDALAKSQRRRQREDSLPSEAEKRPAIESAPAPSTLSKKPGGTCIIPRPAALPYLTAAAASPARPAPDPQIRKVPANSGV